MHIKQPSFALSIIAFSLASAMAHAENAPQPQESQELQRVYVRGDSTTRRVTARKMDETANTKLRDVLKQESSISFGGGNGTSSFLYIRGMGQNSIDVKVDNAYTDSQIHYHQGRHMLDPSMVKIVAVQKGAGSASAGIGQTNGAIIAKTLDAADLLKNSSNPNFGAKVNAGYTTNDGHNLGLSLFGKAGQFDYLLAGSYTKDHAYKGGSGYHNRLDGARTVPYSALNKASYLAKIGATFDDHRITLSHLHQQHKGDRLVREEFLPEASNPRLTLARQAPAARKMSVDNTNLEWTGKNLGFVQSANANVYRLVHNRWSADDSGNGYAGGTRNTGPTNTKIITTGANINLDSQITDNILLKYGLNYRHQKIRPNQLFQQWRAPIGYQTKQDIGIYTEAIANIGDKVTLTGGLRYDHFRFNAMDGKTRSSGAVNPSLNVIYQATPELSFRALHNYATRSPRMQDAIMSHGARGIVSIGDHTKAERARNTEIGFNFERNGFNVEGSYFWQNISNALGTSNGRNNHICPSTGPSANCYQEIINAGRIKNRGYELSVGYRQGGFTARLGVAHAKPRFYGDNLSSNPEYASAIGRTWTASLAYRFENPNLEIGIQHRQVERVKAADNYFVVNGGIVPTPATGKAGYGVTDVSLNWKPLRNDKMNVNFGIDNLTNKLYYPHAQRGQFPGEGRQYRFSMNYTF